MSYKFNPLTGLLDLVGSGDNKVKTSAADLTAGYLLSKIDSDSLSITETAGGVVGSYLKIEVQMIDAAVINSGTINSSRISIMRNLLLMGA